MPAATSSCPSGVSSAYCGPTSNSATSPLPRAALRTAACSRFGRIEGRMTSRSAAIGLARATGIRLPAVKRPAIRPSMKEKVTASMRPRAARARFTIVTRRCAGVMAASGSAVSSAIGTDGMRSKPWTRSTSSTRSASPSTSARQDGTSQRSTPSLAFTAKPSACRIRCNLGGRQIETAQALDAVGPQGEATVEPRQLAGTDDVAGLAAAELQDQARRHFGTPHGALRIEAALEAVAGVGFDAELAAAGGRARGIEQRHLEEHLGGVRRAAGDLAAHDAADAMDLALVGDHGHASRRARRSCRRGRGSSRRRGRSAW